MKHLKIFENFPVKDSYEFDVYEFYEMLRTVIYDEMDKYPQYTIMSMSGDFLTMLHEILPSNWPTYPLNKIISTLVEKTLEQKEIEFTPLISATSIKSAGRVKNAICRTAVMTGFLRFEVRIYLYDGASPIDIDCKKPIKIYGKKSLFQDELELRSMTNKYNL